MKYKIKGTCSNFIHKHTHQNVKIKQRLIVFDSDALTIATVKTPKNTTSQLDQPSETATRTTGKIFNS